MDRTKDVPEVTQADRNGAVRLLEAGGQDWQAKEIRLGQGDHFPIVQAFARHRTEATRPLTAEIADLRAQLDEAMEALEGVLNMWSTRTTDRARAILAERKQP